MIIGITEDTDFASSITLPNNNPKDAPTKPIKKKVKQWRKNCPPVLAISTMSLFQQK